MHTLQEALAREHLRQMHSQAREHSQARHHHEVRRLRRRQRRDHVSV